VLCKRKSGEADTAAAANKAVAFLLFRTNLRCEESLRMVLQVAVDASSPMQRGKGELSSIASTSGQTSWTLKKRYRCALWLAFVCVSHPAPLSREFHSLHQALVSKRYHHNGIPKLPPKKILFIGGDAVQELATDRQKALQSLAPRQCLRVRVCVA
jgi:hypothetical protein